MNELAEYQRRCEPDLSLGRKLTIAVWIVTGLVLFLVGLMRRVTIALPDGVSLSILPPFHALLNTGAAIALVVALLSIKQGQVDRHRRWIFVAMGCSGVFLLSYVLYHFTTSETIFGDLDGDGALTAAEKEAVSISRPIYFVVLLSHIALAAISLPFILLTFVYGFTNQFTRHRKLARRVFPVWLYVAVTGPIVYLLLRPYY